MGNDPDLEVIKNLQNELDAIGVQKERDFLSNKNSWDILEKEKNRKAFIKLESLKSGYHDPTIMKIYVKVIDMTIPAPHDNWLFSHYSTSQDEIKEEVKRTFQQINALQPNLKTSQSDIINFLNKDGDSAPLDELNSRKNKIPQHDWNNCDKKKFVDKELHDALFNHMNGSSSPGPDGFTVNWLRVFWPDLKDLTRNALNSSFGKGLTKTLRTAIIKILRKGDKDPMEASSYRPISLLSIFYKLASCVITRRIKPVVEQLICKEQKAYIKSNNIGSCILNLLNLMKFANDKKKAWLILLIDFNKAFNSISHEFLNNTLELLGFGEDMREWIKIFFNKREANVLINGHLSNTIKLEQGVPQGDVVSPYIFLLMVEILLIKISKTKHLTGVKYASTEDRASGFVDDCTLFLERTEQNLRNCINILNDFWKISGLKCNVSKTKVIPVGNFEIGGLCDDLGLTWDDSFTILGIDIDNKLKCLDDNFARINKKVRGIISRWTGYNLSFHGKITVCKTLMLSQYTYVGGILDCIKTHHMEETQSQLDYYINHGKNTPKMGQTQAVEKKGKPMG